MGDLIVVFVALAMGWAIQFYLAFRQAQAFRARVQVLQRLGATAVGEAGSRTRKVYCALSADPAGVTTAAEILRGVTVFARPHPVDALVGKPLEELASAESDRLLDRATADAANALLAARGHDDGEGVSDSGAPHSSNIWVK